MPDGLARRRAGRPRRARRSAPRSTAGLRYDARVRAPRIACPTLVLWGREDRLLPVAMGEELHRLIPGSRLVVWDGTGHCPMLEDPARFDAAVTAFVGESSRLSDRSDGMSASDVFIAGAFVTPFGKFPDRTLRSLAADARRRRARRRRRDARRRRRGLLRQRRRGLSDRPGVHPRPGRAAGAPACSASRSSTSRTPAPPAPRPSSSPAPRSRPGTADVALAIGAEKLTNPDRAKTFAVFNTGWDVERYGGPDPTAKQSAFMGVYARAGARLHGAHGRDRRGLRARVGQVPRVRRAEPERAVPRPADRRRGAREPRRSSIR